MTPLPISNYEDYKKYTSKKNPLEQVAIDQFQTYKCLAEIDDKLEEIINRIDELANTVKNMPVWEKE